MGSPSVTEAGRFSTEAIPNRYYLDGRPTDQFFDVLPFEPVAGKELKLNYADASTQGLANYATYETAAGAINASLPSLSERTFSFARISAELQVDSILPSIYGSDNNFLEALTTLKVNAVRDKFKVLLIEGDSATSGEVDGLKKHCNTFGQEMGAASNGANGGTVAAGEMEELLSMVTPRQIDGSTYFVMNASAFMHLLKNSYSDVEYLPHPILGSVPAIAGVPVVIDDFITTAETKGSSSDCTSIFAVRVGKDVGLCGIYPAADQGQPIQVRGPVVKESTGVQWYHVSWNVGIAVFVNTAIARMDGVKWSN